MTSIHFGLCPTQTEQVHENQTDTKNRKSDEPGFLQNIYCVDMEGVGVLNVLLTESQSDVRQPLRSWYDAETTIKQTRLKQFCHVIFGLEISPGEKKV